MADGITALVKSSPIRAAAPKKGAHGEVSITPEVLDKALLRVGEQAFQDMFTSGKAGFASASGHKKLVQATSRFLTAGFATPGKSELTWKDVQRRQFSSVNAIAGVASDAISEPINDLLKKWDVVVGFSIYQAAQDPNDAAFASFDSNLVAGGVSVTWHFPVPKSSRPHKKNQDTTTTLRNAFKKAWRK